MSTQYRIIVLPEFHRELRALALAAKTQPGGLRDRELVALRIGVEALTDGREEDFGGRRLGYSPKHHDLRDCAEIKLPVVPQSRGDRDLGPSHRLTYREFEAEDGGLPYRELVSFAPRQGNRAFIIAAERLGRKFGTRATELTGLPEQRPTAGPQAHAVPTGPIRQPLPPDLAKALAAASGVAPAKGATSTPAASALRAPPTSQQANSATDRTR
jgi:hypothetical protein